MRIGKCQQDQQSLALVRNPNQWYFHFTVSSQRPASPVRYYRGAEAQGRGISHPNVPTCRVSGVDFNLNLKSETVDQSYPSEPVCLPQSATVREAMQQMNDRNEAAVLICQDGRLVGIFTERDALKRMASGANCDTPITEAMTQRPAALSSRDTVGTAIAKLSQGGYRRLPIVDDQGRPTGILKMEGILHYLIEHFPTVIYNLPPEPHHVARDTDGA